MASEKKPKIEDLQREAEELTPEQAEAAEGGLLLSSTLMDKHQVAPELINTQPTLVEPMILDSSVYQKW